MIDIIIQYIFTFLVIFFVPGAYYISRVMETDDSLFFMRKWLVARILQKEGFKNLYVFFESLLETTDKDWIYYKSLHDLTYKINDDIRVGFRKEKEVKEIIFYSFSPYRVIASITSYAPFTEVRVYGKVFGKVPYTNEKEFQLLQLIQKLDTIFKNKKADDIALREKEMKKAKEKKIVQTKDKTNKVKEALLLAIKKYDKPFSEHSFDDFLFQFKDTSYSSNLLISFKGEIYFSYVFLKQTSEKEIKFHAHDNSVSKTFIELTQELTNYAEELCKQANKSEKKLPLNNPFSKDVSLIKETFDLLKDNETWLSTESMHKITHTLPNDLENLMKVYEAVENKNEVQEQTEKAINTVRLKQEAFFLEIEKNKKQKLEHIQQVIEVR